MSEPPSGQTPYGQGATGPQHPPAGGRQSPPPGEQPAGERPGPPPGERSGERSGQRPDGDPESHYGQPGYGNPAGYGPRPGYAGRTGYGEAPHYPTAPNPGDPTGGDPGAAGPPRLLAGWGARVGATVLDAVFTGIPGAIGSVIFTAGSMPATVSVDGGTETVITPGSWPGVGVILLAVVLNLISIGLSVYTRYILQGRTGQTWGKKVLRLRLLGMDTGQPIGAGNAFVRDLAHLLDGLPCLLGYLWPIWDEKRQTFADKLLRTVVITEA